MGVLQSATVDQIQINAFSGVYIRNSSQILLPFLQISKIAANLFKLQLGISQFDHTAFTQWNGLICTYILPDLLSLEIDFIEEKSGLNLTLLVADLVLSAAVTASLCVLYGMVIFADEGGVDDALGYQMLLVVSVKVEDFVLRGLDNDFDVAVADQTSHCLEN